MKHTQGKVRVISIRTNTFNSNTIYYILNEEENSISHSIKECEDNEQLITEAFNVTNESGLTPRQLLEQRNELLDLMKDIYNKWQNSRDFRLIEVSTQIQQAINNAQNATPADKAGK